MKRIGILAFLLTSTLLQNCDHNITISSTPSRYIANDFIEKINDKEKLSKGIKKFLHEEQNLHHKDLWGRNAFQANVNPKYVPEANPKFPLPYYLIPDTDSKLFRSESPDQKIMDQLYVLVSGTKYYKLFIHPESEEHYHSLKNAYRYIGPTETEFMSSPTSAHNTLLVWNEGNTIKRPFIAKVTIGKNLITGNDIVRSVTNQRIFESIGTDKLEKMNVKIFPESVGLILSRELSGHDKSLGGQIIEEIPNEIQSGNKKWISFSALLSPNHKPQPLIMSVIKKSKMTSYDFFEKYMITSYLTMFENLQLKREINFEPQAQNLLFELTTDLNPTEKWVLRDFSETRKGNFINSYAVFYKKQVFDVMLAEVAKFDQSLTNSKIEELKNKIDSEYLKRINSYLTFKLKQSPDIMTYRKIEQMVLNQSNLTNSSDKKVLKSGYELHAFLERKKSRYEWIELSSETFGNPTYYLTDHAVYQVIDDRMTGIALFDQSEIENYKNSSGVEENFLKKFRYQPSLGCFGMIRNFFR